MDLTRPLASRTRSISAENPTGAPGQGGRAAVAPAGGLNSFWEMPFASRAKVSVTNLTDQTIEGCFYQITWAEQEVAGASSCPTVAMATCPSWWSPETGSRWF